MNEDAELLRRYAIEHSEPAFAELIRRHVDLVYSAALRVVNGDAHRAQDVTQQVFAEFARQAKRLVQHPAPVGWLYITTRRLGLRVIRTEQRRNAREKEATTMNELLRESAPEPDWVHLRPVLEDAMCELGEQDRHAVLLRFFQNKSLKDVGQALNLGENAARMRVDRALDKLRAVLMRRGISPGASLASVISAHAVQVAPAGLATTLTAASIATTGTGTITLLKIMMTTQVKLGLSAIVVAGAATALVVQHQAQEKLRGENESLMQQIAQLKADNESLSNRLTVTSISKPLANDQLNELLTLRGEVGILKRQTNEMETLRMENRRLHSTQAVQHQNTQQIVADTLEQEKQANIAKINNARQGALAFLMFANDNQLTSPTDFTQTARYLKNDDLMQIQTNYDIAYFGSLSNIINPSETIIFKEKQAWQSLAGKWFKTYSFADGHSEIHSEPDGNFDNYEADHIVLPPPNQ